MQITFTDSAKKQIHQLIEEGILDDPSIKLVSGCAGCSGLALGIAVDEPASEQDRMVEADGIKVLLDPETVKYADNTTIDYEDNEFGGNFILSNEYGSNVCFVD